MIFRTWSFADITLTPEEAEAYLQESIAWTNGRSTGETLGNYRDKPPSALEDDLRRRYHEGSEARERLDVIEEWIQHLLRLFADMTPLEQNGYGRRVQGLLQVANATIMREVRKAQLEMYEEHLGRLDSPAHKITLHTWKDDLTRIHEAALAARLYSEKTEISQIVDLYYIERPPKDMGSAYRAGRSRTSDRRTPSVKLLTFMKELGSQLTPERREQLIDHLMKLRHDE